MDRHWKVPAGALSRHSSGLLWQLCSLAVCCLGMGVLPCLLMFLGLDDRLLARP